MRNWSPLHYSILALVGLFVVLVVWETVIEPGMFVADEAADEKWVEILIGMICGTAALIVPTLLAVNNHKARAEIEAQLIDAIETVPEGFVIYDTNDQLIRCNSKFREIYQYSETEAAPGVTWTALAELDVERGVRIDGKSGAAYLEARAAFRATSGGEQEIQLPDGRWLSTRERVTATGNRVSVQADITDIKLAQQALSESERHLREALENMSEAFVYFDPEGRVILCNRRYRELYGYSQEDVQPGTTRETLRQYDIDRGRFGDRQATQDFLKDRRKQLTDGTEEIEFPMADGRQILSRARKLEDGSVVSIQADITALKAAQDALREREGHLSQALENMSEAFVYFDAEGKLIVCNSRYRELYGYSEDEAKPGTTTVELGKIDRQRGVLGTPEQTEEFLARRRPQLRDGAEEDEFQLFDGRWLLSRAKKLENGSVVSTQADVTAFKQAQAKLAESEQRLRDAIENLDEGFVFFDADDRLVIANTTYKKMYPAQENIKPGTSFKDAISLSIQAGEVPSAVGNEMNWIERRLAQHRELELVEEQYLLDGRWVRVSERRTTDGGSVGIRADITALKESQMTAEAANRAKTAFLAHMSHELRTPLNSIIGFSEVLREQIFGELGESNREYADNIHRSGVHLLSLISDILDISKVEVGELQPYEEDVAIAEVAADCVAMMRPKAIEKGLRMEIEAPDNLPLVRMDLRHLKQILLNLLSNAIKFTGRGGQIVLACENGPAGSTRVSVTDTGIGIPSSDQAKVFEPFSQVANPEIRSGEGTGLGLYLVKSLAELNGGRVSLVSKVGDGTTVSLTFPLERHSLTGDEPVN